MVSYGDEFSQMLCGATEVPKWTTSGCAVVYSNGWVSITGIGDFSITATLSDDSSYTVSGTAVPRKMTPTVATARNKTYDGSTAVTVTDVPLEGVISEGEVSVDLSGVTGTLSGAGAGHYDTLTLSGLKLTGRRADCYTIDDTVQVATDVTVEQAAAPAAPDRVLSWQTGDATTATLSLAGWLPADAGALTYTAGRAEDPDGLLQDWQVAADGTLTYTLAGTGASGRVVLPVTVQSANYAPVTARVVLEVTGSQTATPAAPEETARPTAAPAAPVATAAPTPTPAPTATPTGTPAPAAATQALPAGPVIPQTGDESHPLLWVVLLTGSALALVGLTVSCHRKKQ